MAFILSLDVMEIRDAINFCPEEENKRSFIFVYLFFYLQQDNSILKDGAEMSAVFLSGKKNLWTPDSQRSHTKGGRQHASVLHFK